MRASEGLDIIQAQLESVKSSKGVLDSFRSLILIGKMDLDAANVAITFSQTLLWIFFFVGFYMERPMCECS